jgi:cytochrome P450
MKLALSPDLRLITSQTYLTMTCLVMVMAMYPEKQALAKAELDQLLCVTRLPTIADRGSLPYIEALIHETLRWHIALPCSESSPLSMRKFSASNANFAGLPRRTAKADEYRGYHIPEGTIVLPNVWYAGFILFLVLMNNAE